MLRARLVPEPAFGVVLGSGLGAFADALEARIAIPFGEIPGMPAARVPGHTGVLVAGRTREDGVPVIALQGRAHLYEGYAAHEVVHGVRLLATLGTRAVILTNAAGGVRPGLAPGSLMLIEDQLNLTGHNPLVGSDGEGDRRFVDMARAYDPQLIALGRAAAEAQGVPVACGIYAGVLGPSYETAAEVRMLRALGADAVGMSTVLEAIALRRMRVRVAGLSCITNMASDGSGAAMIEHDEVARVGRAAAPRLGALLTAWLAAIAGAEGTA